MKKSILILWLSLMTICAYGQSARLVHGCVHGKGKAPIEGATISTVQGDFICKSDASGQFQASTKSYITQIKVSCEGFGSQIVNLDGSYLIVNLSGRTPQAKRSLGPVKRGYEQEISITNQYFLQCESMMLNANYIGGYRFSPHLFLGLGTGVDINILSALGSADFNFIGEEYRYAFIRYSPVTIPIYAHLRVYASKKRCAPFFGFSGGMRITTERLAVGDVEANRSPIHAMAEVSAGLNIRCSNKFAFNIQVGFPFGTSDAYDRVTESVVMEFELGYTARIGFVF